ncbi:MAG: PAS domain S-box protein [Campylobacterota bacterium]
MPNLSHRQNALLDKYVIYSATDLKGIITDASEAFCNISGYSKEELIGKPHSIVKHPDMDKEVFIKLWDTIVNGGVWEGDIKNRNKNGLGYWVHARVEPILDEDNNKIIGYFAVREDISDKMELDRVNKDLQDQINIVEAVLNNSKTAIATVDAKGCFKSANSYFLKKFQCLQDKELSQTFLSQLIAQDKRQNMIHEVQKQIKQKGKAHFKRVDLLQNCNDAKSKNIPAEVYLTQLADKKTIVVVMNFIEDKLKLKNSLKKSKTYFKKASVGFFITDKEGLVVKANPKFRDMVGYKKSQIKGSSIRILFKTVQKYEHFQQLLEKSFSKEREFSAVFLLQKSDGSEFWAEISASKFLDEEVLKNESVFWTVRDITSKIESKQLIQEQNEKLIYLNENLKKEVQKKLDESIKKDKLHQEQQLKNVKYSAIGQLAAGITHEINTPLTYINGNFEMLELDIDDIENTALKDDIKQQIKPIKEGLQRIGNIVENMREISQKTKEQKVVTNIYATMITAMTVLHNRSKHVAKIYLNGEEFGLGMPKDKNEFLCYAQPQRLEQVWVILLNNALDELEKIESYEKRKLRVEIEQNDINIYVKVMDNAGGIATEVLKNIFEPFVGDKSSKGMGIGLNVAKQIITQQDGTIKVANEKEGAAFMIKLKRYTDR